MREMAAVKEEHRIFVGGLSRDVTDRQLEHAFDRFGKIIDSQIMLDRDTRRPRGFGFLTFADRRAMDDAIKAMHGKEFGDRVISVNKAQPRMAGEDSESGYRGGGGYQSHGKPSYGGGRDRPPAGQDECFKCGRSGHWARDCPSSGGGRGGGPDAFPMRSRFDAERFGGVHDRLIDDRYDGGRYGERERFDSRDKYASRDRYASDRYQPGGDRFITDRYGGDSDRYPHDGYGRDRSYDRDIAPPTGGDKYGNGRPGRVDRGYRSRPAPYDRPTRGGGGGHHSAFDRY